MPRRKIKLVNQEFYHIIKRSIDNRLIFSDPKDCIRAINSLLVFNDKNLAPWEHRGFWNEQRPKSLTNKYTPKDPLVEIHAFALMPNHIHLLVRQLVDNGIQNLMHKFSGFSRYFNKKYKRKGPLFEDSYKVIHIENEIQLRNVFIYIHTNPIGLVELKWKEWEVKNPSKALKFLENTYRWSSLWDYLGKENFPKLTKKDFFLELLDGEEGIREEITSWVNFKNDVFKDKENLRELVSELE